MRALTLVPGVTGSVRLDDVPEPDPSHGSVLVETLAVGVCGTDMEIIQGLYGSPPPGEERLILGHESLGRVLEAPAGSGLEAGDLVVGIVRRPDPVPCINCAVGEWDMCRNGQYTESGIKDKNGFCAERYRIEPEYAVKVDPSLARVGMLLEPASVVAKAWEQVERIGSRARWEPKKALVTGAGPVGLLAALMGVQRGLEVHVLDRTTDGPKPGLVADMGATYHTGNLADAASDADVVIECTGVGQLIFDAMAHTAANGIVCLTGISSGGRTLPIDAGMLNRSMVLENDVVVGSVNANRRHYEAGAKSLAAADHGWLERLITRRVPLERWAEAIERQPGDVKTVIEVKAA
jgi:threonine dehydrogenase-like Zn-dependent dehydrogenase